MKKITSILFLAMLVLNIMGYYGLFLSLDYQNTQNITAKLDGDQYTADETFMVKVPLSIPYHLDEENFSRVDGEIEHNGEVLRLVKQKYAKDTLYIVCIKDHQGKKIRKALTDYVKTFADRPHDNKGQSKTFSTFIKDYLPSETRIETGVDGWQSNMTFTELKRTLPSVQLALLSPPPRA